MRDSVGALAWIVSELMQRQIPFAVVGGLAVRAYGGQRALSDIDIDVPDAAILPLSRALEAYVTAGPKRLVEDPYDCLFLELSFAEQEIELTGADTFRIRDSRSGDWRDWPTDLSAVEQRIVLGMRVPVLERSTLIAYKQIAGRPVDLADVAFLEAAR